MHHISSFLLLFLFGLIRVVNGAELTFTQTTATFDAPITASGQDVVFEFSNKTDEIITITDIHNGCGCITSQLEKKVYAPGEAGALQVHVDFQDRTGNIKKIVRLVTHGQDIVMQHEQLLKIEGIAQTPLILSGLTASWASGDACTTKEIIVSVKAGYHLEGLRIDNPTLNEHFLVESVPLKNGGLLIRITPHLFANDQVTLINDRELQQPYLLTYTDRLTGISKRERFYAIIYK